MDRRVLGLVAGAAAVAFAAIGAGLAAPSSAASPARLSGACSPISPVEAAQQVAQLIQAGGGKPTADGELYLQAAQNGGAAPVAVFEQRGRAQANGESYMTIEVLAVGQTLPRNASAPPPADASAPPAVAPAPPAPVRTMQSRSRAVDWTGWYPIDCWPGATGHILFYIAPGTAYSRAKGRFLFGGEKLTPIGPGCSIVNNGWCLIEADGIPGLGDTINAMKAYQSSPGLPIVEYVWCP